MGVWAAAPGNGTATGCAHEQVPGASVGCCCRLVGAAAAAAATIAVSASIISWRKVKGLLNLETCMLLLGVCAHSGVGEASGSFSRRCDQCGVEKLQFSRYNTARSGFRGFIMGCRTKSKNSTARA